MNGLLEVTDSAINPLTETWLCHRFDKKQFLIDAHLKSIINIQQLHKESYHGFRHMLDGISKHFNELDDMRVP